MNSLVDEALIEELYAASPAGVEIDLIVRGICCLRPGVPGLSDRIRVGRSSTATSSTRGSSISRTAGSPSTLLASADWMPRNLDHRVEIAFPILDPALQAQLRQMLDTQLADNVKARIILPDGITIRAEARGAEAIRSQERIYQLIGGAQHD